MQPTLPTQMPAPLAISADRISAIVSGASTSGNPGTGFAGTIALTATTLTPALRKTIYNNNITDNSIIILGCERTANSTSAILYAVNVAYDNAGTSWQTRTSRNVNGTLKSFDIDIRQAAGGNIASGSGCAISYLIIN